MIALDLSDIPTTSADLSTAIDRAIRKYVTGLGPTPVVIDGELPNLNRLTIDVSGGVAVAAKPPVADAAGNLEEGPVVQSLQFKARPITADNVSADVELLATGVTFAHGKSAAGKVVVTLKSAVDGSLSVAIKKRQLQTAILAAAKAATASAGVEIKAVDVTLKSVSPHAVDVLLAITVKKFMTAVVNVSGRLAIDDAMVAVATGLKVDGEGMVGSVAAGFIRPQLQKLEGHKLSLMTFSLGDVRLRDVAVSTTDGLQVDAKFGSGS